MELKQTIMDRIREFQSIEGISNYVLERQVGKANGYMRNCKNPNADVVAELLRVYPKLSAEWLLRGEGQMYRGVVDTPSISERLDAALDDATFNDINRRVLENIEAKMTEMAEAAVRQAFSQILKKA